MEAEPSKMVVDPKYRYVNFEDKLNESGYDLLNAGWLPEAIYIFQLNTKLYPASANTFDSLGEGYWKSGETAKAVEAYNKAISLDPAGVTRQNATDILKKISRNRRISKVR